MEKNVKNNIEYWFIHFHYAKRMQSITHTISEQGQFIAKSVKNLVSFVPIPEERERQNKSNKKENISKVDHGKPLG